MLRRLVAAIVTVLLGLTPSLALACDARCLAGHGSTTGAVEPADPGHSHRSHLGAGRAHAGPAAHSHHSDAAGGIRVTAEMARPASHHGCKATFDEGALDRQPASTGLGATPACEIAAEPAPAVTLAANRAWHVPAGWPPSRASLPLRI